MPMTEAPATGYGTTLTMASGFFAEIIDVTLPEQAREAIDVSHTESPEARREFMPEDLVDSGELEVQIHFDPSMEPPIDDPPEACVLTFGSGTEWTFVGFLTNYGGEAPLDDKMTADCTIKITGKINVSASGGS